MRTWMAMRQAMAALDLVMRVWARQLRLSAGELMVIMLLGDQPRRCCAELALLSGRRRQQTQRTLAALHRRGFVQPARTNKKGRVQAWELTAHGRTCLERLEARVRDWDDLLSRRLDLEHLTANLQRTVEVIVRYPTGGNGWEEALNWPLEPIDRDPAAVLDALRREANALVALDPPAPAEESHGEGAGARGVSELVSKVDANTTEEDEWDAVGRAFHAMWQ